MAEKWLVIDDSATIQRVIKLAFQDYDVLITEADSVQEALRELVSTPSSLVIVDAALAGVQSVHDFSRLHQTSPKSAFVILEGSYDHIDENQFRGAGFRFFLKKPFDAAQLIAITREALGRPIPHRYSEEKAAPPAQVVPSTFSFHDEPKDSPPPPPPAVTRNFVEEFTSSFRKTDTFDLGLEYFNKAETEARPETKVEPVRPEPFGIDPFEAQAFRPEQFKAKPYHPEVEREAQLQAAREEPIAASLPPIHQETSPLNSGIYKGPSERFGASNEDTAYISSPLSGMLEPMLQEEMSKLVRQSVEEYCRKHFTELAREFLMREIDKLSQERSRLLVDK